jgi:hypothetical protein
LRGGDGNDKLFAGWSDATLSYEQRIVAIRDTGVGTSAPLSRLAAGYSAFPDGDQNQLFGDGDRDWFFATTAGPNSLDLFSDRQLDEELTLLN